MDTLLYAVLSNAAVTAVLAVMATGFGRISRRPALVHSLWIIVLLKLLTPPLWPVSLSWLVRSQEGPVLTDAPAVEPTVVPQLVDTVPQLVVREQKAVSAPEEMPMFSAPAPALQNPAAISPEAPRTPVPLTFPEPSIPAAAAPFSQLSWQAWLVSIWLSGSACWLALAGYRLYRFHRILRFTQRAPVNVHDRARLLAERLGLRHCPRVWVVPAPISPLLWALVGEPRLLVPASLLVRLTEEQWDTLLAHELAHLRRRDHWVRILELACLGLYWWHPAVWWARRQLREVEEQCCDAWVVWALPGAAETYATALVEAVTYLSGARSALPLAASGIGAMRLLKRRLNMIMRGTTPRSLSSAGSLAVLGLAVILLPWCPTLAQTEQPFGIGNAPAASDSAASAGRSQSSGAAAAPSAGTHAPDRAGSGAANPASGASGGSRGSQRSQPAGFFGTISEGTAHPESVEDAQDEVDLLHIQLQLREAERREAQARLNEAKRVQQRVSRLAATAGASQDEVDHAKTEVEVQEARLLAKEAQIQEAQLRLKQAQRRLTRLREQAPLTPERRRGAMGGAPEAAGGSGSIYAPDALSGGGRGGRDPNKSFNMLSNGKDVAIRSEIQDPRMQMVFDRMAERMGITNGQITRQQFLAYREQLLAERGRGGFQSSPPGATGTPGAPGAPSDRGGFRDRRGNPDDTAEGMFQRLDLNGDGYLNFDEMPPQLRNERDQWDKDRNGLIDLNEFRAYYQARVQPPSTGQSATSGGGGTSFTGGSGFSGGGTSFSGRMSGGPGGMGVGPGNVSAYEHRLAEVEKKLQTLIDVIKRRGLLPRGDEMRLEHGPENAADKP